MNCSARDTWRIEKQCLRDLNPVFLTCRLPNHHEPSETLREEEGKWKNASRFAQPPPAPPQLSGGGDDHSSSFKLPCSPGVSSLDGPYMTLPERGSPALLPRTGQARDLRAPTPDHRGRRVASQI